MQYYKLPLNNRLPLTYSPHPELQSTIYDSESETNDENTFQNLPPKREPSISTIDSCFNSPKLSAKSGDMDHLTEFQKSEICLGFVENGYCLEGQDCCFAHEVQQMAKKKSQCKKAILEDFPELILEFPLKRMKSFLQ